MSSACRICGGKRGLFWIYWPSNAAIRFHYRCWRRRGRS